MAQVVVVLQQLSCQFLWSSPTSLALTFAKMASGGTLLDSIVLDPADASASPDDIVGRSVVSWWDLLGATASSAAVELPIADAAPMTEGGSLTGHMVGLNSNLMLHTVSFDHMVERDGGSTTD